MPQEYVVYADSNNRDQILFPNSNNYTLHLTTPIRNVSKVELLTAMLPGMNTSQFITLDILELRTPTHLTAASLQARGTSNLMVPTANAFYGSFATIPIKVQGNDEFYNANYRITTEFPSRIDKIDRLTITWRQPNNGNVFMTRRGPGAIWAGTCSCYASRPTSSRPTQNGRQVSPRRYHGKVRAKSKSSWSWSASLF